MLDREAIEQILPHRPPFLFVDEVVEIEPGLRIVGRFQVREAELFLGGKSECHFPATLIAEAMAQVGAILVLYPEENRGRTIYFRSIEQAEFRQDVLAGSELRVEAQVRKMRARYGSLSVSAFLAGELVARGIMSFALG